ncbi:hypothetical protein [Emticicia sp. BO119]|uniref:hypothetical protein n=1 Tax=Emticicia sp. BO119 TaxID=2757768 RepID=UPI0015F0497F|nr:hypothetical protein [Emticicia sp. BO119]MBA4853844.1 hypothetical protein [Emticicia sp. BO119]
MEEIWSADFADWKIENQELFKDAVSLEEGTLRISDAEPPMVSYTLSSPIINELENLNYTDDFTDIVIVANVKLFINQTDNAFICIHNSNNDFWLNYQVYGDPAQINSTPNSKNLYDIIVPVLTYDSNEAADVQVVLKPQANSDYDVLGAATQLKLRLVIDQTVSPPQKSYFEVRSLKIMGQPASALEALEGNPDPGTGGPKIPPPPIR